MSTRLIGSDGLVFHVRTVNWALLLGTAASFGWQPVDMVYPMCAEDDEQDGAVERDPVGGCEDIDLPDDGAMSLSDSEESPHVESTSSRVYLEEALIRILEILRCDPGDREREAAKGISTDCNHCKKDLLAHRIAAIEALDAANGAILIEFVLSMMLNGEVAIDQ